MDFKTKTALCIARLYSSSACVFWLAQTTTERAQLKDAYWCRNKLEVVFSCRVPCLWAWSSIPRTPLPPRAGSCQQEFQLWAQQEGAPSWRHHLGAAAAALGSAEQWEILQGCDLSPGERAACWNSPVLQQDLAQGSPGLQPLGRGGTARAGQELGAALTPHRGCTKGSPGQNIARFTPKAKNQGHCTADLCSW